MEELTVFVKYTKGALFFVSNILNKLMILDVIQTCMGVSFSGWKILHFYKLASDY